MLGWFMYHGSGAVKVRKQQVYVPFGNGASSVVSDSTQQFMTRHRNVYMCICMCVRVCITPFWIQLKLCTEWTHMTSCTRKHHERAQTRGTVIIKRCTSQWQLAYVGGVERVAGFHYPEIVPVARLLLVVRTDVVLTASGLLVPFKHYWQCK